MTFPPAKSMVFFSIETRVNEASDQEYVIFAMHRKGRGNLDDMQAEEAPGGNGYILTFTAQDETVETMGSVDDPVPYEVLAQAQTDAGLTIIYVDEKAKVVSGQKVWGPEVQPKAAPSLSLR